MTDTVVSALTIAIISRHYVVCLGLQKMFESRETSRFLVHAYQRMMPDVLLPENRPDVFILDMETERDVIITIKQITEAGSKSKILLLSGDEDKERTREAMDCGVDGVILKIQPPKVVLAAVDALYSPVHNHAVVERNGMRIVDPQKVSNTNTNTEIQSAVWPDALTEREREVIGLVGQGLSNKDIAYRLSISDSTVRHHLTSIFDKVGVPNRQKLLVHAHHVHSMPG